MIALIVKVLIFSTFTTAEAINDRLITSRLPNDTRPIRYDLDYQTWIHEPRFDYRGSVRIHLKVLVPKTKIITLHSIDQPLFGTELRMMNGRLIPTLPRRFEPENQFVIIETVNRILLEFEEFVLTIEFNSNLHFDFSGFYRSSYVNEDGQTKWLATTHFHPTYARRAFPCYDEPGIRAVFGLTLRHGTYYQVAGNMPISRVILGLVRENASLIFLFNFFLQGQQHKHHLL
jgi:aminopeptidase N